MNKWILALAIAFTMQPALADQVDELGVEAEAEELEVFDHKALESQQKKETAEMDAKSKRLEREIEKLRRESKSISKRIDSQSDRFARTQRLAIQTERLAKQAEAQRNQLKSQLESLRSRTQQSQNRLQSAQELQRNLKVEIRAGEKEKRDLQARYRTAEQRLAKATRAIKENRNKQRRLSQSNQQLRDRAASMEARADAADERSLESEMR